MRGALAIEEQLSLALARWKDATEVRVLRRALLEVLSLIDE